MISDLILFILKSTNKPMSYYLNGGCYIFANHLRELVGGEIIYIIDDYHFVLSLGNKLYDASGNVTSKYRGRRVLSESEFMKRKRLVKEFRIK